MNWLLILLSFPATRLFRSRWWIRRERRRAQLRDLDEHWDEACERIALSWLMMMYARADGDWADAKLEACYHKLHFGEWPTQPTA